MQEELGITMHIIPLSLGHGDEGYRVYGGRSKYLQEELGRTMHTIPLSLGARNEGYQVYGGKSNCFQEEIDITRAHRSSYPFDKHHTLRDTLLKSSTSTNVEYPREIMLDLWILFTHHSVLEMKAISAMSMIVVQLIGKKNLVEQQLRRKVILLME